MTENYLFIYDRKLFPKRFIHVKNYMFYIDTENYKTEMEYQRIVDAKATTNILSISRIITKFNISSLILNEAELSIFNKEREYLLKGYNHEQTFNYLMSTFNLKKIKLIYLLNRIDAKFYVCETLYNKSPLDLQ